MALAAPVVVGQVGRVALVFMVAQAVRAGQVAPQALAVPADLVARHRNAHKTVSKSATKSVNPDFRQWRREHKPIGL